MIILMTDETIRDLVCHIRYQKQANNYNITQKQKRSSE